MTALQYSDYAGINPEYEGKLQPAWSL